MKIIKIEVRVFATLRRYLPELGVGEAKNIEISEGTTFEMLHRQLALPRDEIKIIMRNGLQTEMEEVIRDGDRIAYIPAVGGG